MPGRNEVRDWLRTFKACVLANRWYVRSRKKNRETLLELGMSTEERREVLLRLEPEDYVSGPEPDHTDPDGKEVWVFGKVVEETEIYIKLRVTEDPRTRNQHRALVWSFHEAEWELNYPFKGGW